MSDSAQSSRSRDTRQNILDAAISSFADVGYEATTIRGVARAAGVDPALVMHYFTNKDGLFDAVATLNFRAVPESLRNASTVRELIESYLDCWEDPDIGPRLKAVVRATIGSRHATGRFSELLALKFENIETKSISKDRLPIAASMLMGVCVARYLVQAPVNAHLEREELVDRLLPALEAVLKG